MWKKKLKINQRFSVRSNVNEIHWHKEKRKDEPKWRKMKHRTIKINYGAMNVRNSGGQRAQSNEGDL